MLLERVVEYSDIFPEETKSPDLESLIRGVGRIHLINLTLNMMKKLVNKPFYDEYLVSTEDNVDYVRFFLSSSNVIFIRNVVHRFHELEKRNKKRYNGVYLATRPAAILYFLRLVFSLPPCEDDFTPQCEINLFKALLIINQRVNEVNSYELDKRLHKDLQLANLVLACTYSNEGLESDNYIDTFNRQAVKCFELFTFISNKKELKQIRERFRRYYGIGYLYQYLLPYIAFVYFVEKGGDLDLKRCGDKIGRMARKIIRRSAIWFNEIINFEFNRDYSCFRSKPYIEIRKDYFVTVSAEFVLKHLYDSLYFQFKKYRAYAGFDSDDKFRTYFTTEFTQNWMFNRFMARCISSHVDFYLSDFDLGKKMKDLKIKGITPPDFYIRNGNSIILFELKDTLPSAQIKEKRNADEFFIDLKKKFYESELGKPKAIRQLVTSIKAIQHKKFVFDSIDSAVTIYPVLVVDSIYYTMRGVHTKLEYWMREYCKQEAVNDSLVKPLILMDISTLALYSDSFRDNGFLKYFESYYRDIKWDISNPKSIFNSLKSFTEYMSENFSMKREGIYKRLQSVIKKSGL